MNKIILKAQDLDGFLLKQDMENLKTIDELYSRTYPLFEELSREEAGNIMDKNIDNLRKVYNKLGDLLQDIIAEIPNIHVYSFETPEIMHGEASRVIAKLRNIRTQQPEFIYYIQRAYELLFNLAYGTKEHKKKNYIFVKTPVTVPVQNYAIHKIPHLDELLENSVMCVMLRGALLPSIIMSKEIQEYSNSNYITPFALFKIYRNDKRDENDMEYILDLNKSFFSEKDLEGKHLIFADPMNATGGSLVTIIQYLQTLGIKPASIKFFNVISALKGSLRVCRAIENVEIYTLWMDPILNKKAYICPGLGDAGDRINGKDYREAPRNIIQLIADFGSNITALYRNQIRKIEETILEP
ncbi:MAG: uracil phosphoribosyltransferase [Spirochaetales bacterium]|nr:uracil phosphoribosyltransferase [Spirochaetales bacterium]